MSSRIAVLLTLVFIAVLAFAQAPDDNAAIKDVVDRAYVQGVHVDADPEKMRGGMHDSFVMLVRNGDAVTSLTRDAWIARLEASKAQAKPDAKKPEIKAEIDVLDSSGDSAVARVKLFRDGKQVFTDYISLYRFESGWKLVGKVFHRH
jgi:Putative lumazine-binding